MSEIEENHKPKFILPTYSGVLNLAIETVVLRFNEGSIIGVWMAIESLVDILPPCVKEDITSEFEEIHAKMQRLERMRRNSDMLQTNENNNNAITRILRERNHKFFEAIVLSLHRHDYLEKGTRSIPTGEL